MSEVLGGWVRTAAATWLLVVGCLAVWSLGPLLAGWRPVVVVTGSMEPRVHPGDVVLVDPTTRTPRAGQVALVRDPGMPTGSRLHRVVRVQPDGGIVTRGDANASEDAIPARRTDIQGVARLLVPAAGRVAMLRSHPTGTDLGWIGATVLACLVLGLVPAARRG